MVPSNPLSQRWKTEDQKPISLPRQIACWGPKGTRGPELKAKAIYRVPLAKSWGHHQSSLMLPASHALPTTRCTMACLPRQPASSGFPSAQAGSWHTRLSRNVGLPNKRYMVKATQGCTLNSGPGCCVGQDQGHPSTQWVQRETGFPLHDGP